MSNLFYISAIQAIIKSIVFTFPFLLSIAEWSDHHKPVLSVKNSIEGTGINKVLNQSITTVKKSTFKTENELQPDWTFNGYYQGKLYTEKSLISTGDINGDGFDDFIVEAELESFTPRVLFVYFGSPTGINKIANQVFEVETGFGSICNAVGDVNGDGYADVMVYHTHLYTGSVSGLNESPRILNYSFGNVELESLEKARPSKAGDVNGDGIDDILFVGEFNGLSFLLFGSADDFSETADWIAYDYINSDDYSERGVKGGSAGDINGDGFGDIYVIAHTRKGYIYYGSPAGPSPHPDYTFPILESEMPNAFESWKIIPGSFNDDDYGDLLIVDFVPVSRFSYAYYHHAYVIYGNENGIDTLSSQYFINELVNVNSPEFLYAYKREIHLLGDLNEDGLTDISIGSTIVYWDDQGDNFFKYDETYKDQFISLLGIGDLNGDNTSDFITTSLQNNAAHRAIYYYNKPYLSGPDSVQFCNYGSTNYLIPNEVRGNIKSIYFRKRGASNYGSNENDFNTALNPGLTTIDWTIEFVNGKSLSLTNIVFIKEDPTPVAIKPNSAHPKGDPNTFYIGYGATAFRIEAIPAGGGGPYTYLWSNGSTEKNPRISESVPGEYSYWVKMKNVHGCESSDTAIIKVENALCSSPLVDVVMSQYPAILQNPLLANLIKSNSKIAVCKDGQTMCFTKAVVDIRIERAGYTIGACTPGVIPAEAFMTDEMEEILRGGLKVIVAPNPSSHSFQLSVVSIYNAPVMIRIMDLAGRQVEILNNASANQTITVGHKLRAGTYIAEVVSGKERKVVKLVKMN